MLHEFTFPVFKLVHALISVSFIVQDSLQICREDGAKGIALAGHASKPTSPICCCEKLTDGGEEQVDPSPRSRTRLQ